MVFISQPAPHINACYGGLMSLRAKYLKAEGVVIDGKLRDLQEHRDLEFPVMSTSTLHLGLRPGPPLSSTPYLVWSSSAD